PLGISFFTFQQLSFIIDSYNEKSMKYDFLSYCLFVTFFPQLIAGPIVLPNEMLPQFEDKRNKLINYENMNRGLYMFSIGLAKKVIIADTIANFANVGFDKMETLNIVEAWMTSISYTLQLYFDFSGYCDMAMGIALMFNIVLPLNFNSPYKSANIQEFWKRWHMTLGRFMTNYLYIPLGGNRLGERKTLRNLFIVFMASGIWHGAGWNFITWGGLHGICILIHRVWKNSGRKMNKLLGWFITINLVNIF
ncbi:MBOAT family O-acyltransferase, partial [uncultured Fusobacterium sp.]|uniref:MBOAT family O-acyltransferase n=1 Tax=uncultured Fusobacterium sp. TaxID=159267 RepID=UPI0025F6771E